MSTPAFTLSPKENSVLAGEVVLAAGVGEHDRAAPSAQQFGRSTPRTWRDRGGGRCSSRRGGRDRRGARCSGGGCGRGAARARTCRRWNRRRTVRRRPPAWRGVSCLQSGVLHCDRRGRGRVVAHQCEVGHEAAPAGALDDGLEEERGDVLAARCPVRRAPPSAASIARGDLLGRDLVLGGDRVGDADARGEPELVPRGVQVAGELDRARRAAAEPGARWCGCRTTGTRRCR